MDTTDSSTRQSTLQTLAYVPLGLFCTVAAADLLARATGNPALPAIARGLLAAGIVSALVVGCCGWRDGRSTRSPRHAGSVRRQLSAYVGVLLLFVASWLLRQTPAGEAGMPALSLSLAGLLGALLLARAVARAATATTMVGADADPDAADSVRTLSAW